MIEWVMKFPSKVRDVIAVDIATVFWSIWRARHAAMFDHEEAKLLAVEGGGVANHMTMTGCGAADVPKYQTPSRIRFGPCVVVPGATCNKPS
jgi:hypothetical protein